MAEEVEKSALEKVVDILAAHGVEFIVVGGQAELLLGSPRITYDIDLCYRRTKENLKRLAAALREIKPTLRNAPADLPFTLDEHSLAPGNNFTFDTSFGPLNLLGYLEPVGNFDAIAGRAFGALLGNCEVKVIHIDDLIATKQYLRRPKDQQSLLQLLAIKKIQSENPGLSG
jgi:hypothetical protein